GTFQATTSVCGKKKIADLVIGQPTVAYVLYGDNSGLSTNQSQRWTAHSPGMAKGTDVFETSMVAGHTVAGHDYFVINGAGTIVGVYVLYTDPTTHLLSTAGSQFYNEDTPGIPDKTETDDRFGTSVATYDINADGEDDLTIGAPDKHQGNGAIFILYGAGT